MKFRFYSDSASTTKKLEKVMVVNWIRSELKRWYGRYNVTTRLNLMVHSKLSSCLHPVEFDLFISDVNEECRRVTEQLRRKKDRKLGDLLKARNDCEPANVGSNENSTQQFHPRLINNTCVQFDRDEEEFLNKEISIVFVHSTTSGS